MKHRLHLFLLLFSASTWAQDQVDLSAFKNLSKKDTLTVNIKNVGCHVANGEYLLFYRIDTNYTMLQFLDFHNAIYLDGKRLNDLEKQKLLLES